jgi:hypothetical protein
LRSGETYILAARGSRGAERGERADKDDVLAAAFVRYEGDVCLSPQELKECKLQGGALINARKTFMRAVLQSKPHPADYSNNDDDDDDLGSYDDDVNANADELHLSRLALSAEIRRWQYAQKRTRFRQLDTGKIYDVDLYGKGFGQRVGTMEVYLDVYAIVGTRWAQNTSIGMTYLASAAQAAEKQQQVSLEMRAHIRYVAATLIQRHWRRADTNPESFLGHKRLLDEYAEMGAEMGAGAEIDAEMDPAASIPLHHQQRKRQRKK